MDGCCRYLQFLIIICSSGASLPLSPCVHLGINTEKQSCWVNPCTFLNFSGFCQKLSFKVVLPIHLPTKSTWTGSSSLYRCSCLTKANGHVAKWWHPTSSSASLCGWTGRLVPITKLSLQVKNTGAPDWWKGVSSSPQPCVQNRTEACGADSQSSQLTEPCQWGGGHGGILGPSGMQWAMYNTKGFGSSSQRPPVLLLYEPVKVL